MIKRAARYNYLVCIYLAGMVFFTLFRLAETGVYCSMSEEGVDFGGLYGHALWNGFRFDTAVSCYMLALPLLMLIVGEVARVRKRWYYGVVHYLLMVLYTVGFFACAADIPYFCYFFQRLDAASLGLTDSFGMAVSMIVSEPMYVVYLGVFVVVSVGWWLLGRLIYRKILLKYLEERLPLGWGIGLGALLLAVGFVGMRGTLSSKSPLRVGTAYYCNNAFLNQIGLNPVFTFMKSMEDAGRSANQPLSLLEESEAEAVLSEWRALPADSTLAEARLRLPEGTNVVLVLMESMSAEKTGLSRTGESLTPSLDSLMERSMTFTEAWSAGIHTHNGIYSSLYGHPALLSRQMIKGTPIPRMYGLPHVLKEAGYRTTYFMTHQEDYDNMRGFLYQNAFDRVVGQSSYPSREVVGTWGVPDHVMFDHMIEHLDSTADSGPFFACAMTCSDHGPYIIPEGIDLKCRHTDRKQAIVEYADWAIGRFMQEASRRPWFGKTLFVFVADHGARMDAVYDMALSYNHVPLLFYAPGRIEAHRVERLAQQIDIAPTVLGLLGLDDGGRMLGTDLRTHTRPYAYFSADDKIGVVDGEMLMIYRVKQKNTSLYRYKELSTDDLAGELPERAAAMRRHAFGLTQSSQRMTSERETR
ncbi:MAG: sulfatase-like hydrolase/transferase [Bacteroidales bacterium]|nr:sulfatase-like hydrolase/transferase [Bacteroidales bacterium]